MVEYKLLIRMTAHILVVEFGIEFRVYFHAGLVLHRPHMLEPAPSRSLILLPLLWQTLHTH